MDPQLQQNNPQPFFSVLSRSRFIFLLLLLLLLTSISGTVAFGLESGELPKKAAQIKKGWQELAKTFEPLPTPTPIKLKTFPAPTITTTPTPTLAPKPKTIYYYQPYPTSTPFPTIIPGRPGSKEWEEEFWRKWDEMGKHNAEMQKKVEDSQKAFCEKNASLCNR